jgi:hypothetical protein
MLIAAFALSVAAAQLFTVKPHGNVVVRGEVPLQTYIAATGEVTWGEMQKVLASDRALEKPQRLILVPATSPHASEPWAVFVTDTRSQADLMITVTSKDDVNALDVNGQPSTLEELARPSTPNKSAKLAALTLDPKVPMSFVGDVATALHERGALIVAVSCDACMLVDKLSPEERRRANENDRRIAKDAIANLDKDDLLRGERYGTKSGRFVGAPLQLPKASGAKSAKLRDGGEVISFTVERKLYTEGALRLLPNDAAELAAFATTHCSQSRQRATAAFDKTFPVVLEIDARAAAADVVALVAAAAPAETFVVVKTPGGYGELALTVSDETADVVVTAKDTLQDIITKVARSKVKNRAPSITFR